MTLAAGYLRDHGVGIVADFIKAQEAIQPAVPLGQLDRLEKRGPGVLGPAQYGDAGRNHLGHIPVATSCHGLGSKSYQLRRKVTNLHARNIGRGFREGKPFCPGAAPFFMPDQEQPPNASCGWRK